MSWKRCLDGRSCKDEIYRMGIGAGYCEGNLNFATASEDDEVYTKKKVSRQDPMSHRIIEKRRRDRMNNCLADLSRLIPAEYLKKGRGRVEKTEIIEMAIRHMKYLQGSRQDTKPPAAAAVHHPEDSVDSVSHSPSGSPAAEHYRLGFQECLSETMHFLVEVEGFFARDSLCVQLISHLQQHCEKILATSDRLGFPHPEPPQGSAVPQFSHTSISNICPPAMHSDQGSSSGVSSFEDPERPRPIIPPPTVVSDDSNQSHTDSQSHSPPSMSHQRPTNYKFKSSIKQRFSAERVKSSPPPSDKPHGVPVFALHDGGNFYVPLTVESSVLRPQLSFVPDTGPETVLHPITISVNFNQAQMTPWGQDQSPHHEHT
ncbi:hairy/enhancer-of-split related with YRPW motif protein isoform X2 [Fopius arisanus]|uniref:Hairy/enhancer-of-split related with YRPW motif protein isoform X2 n=1 Tax=Fopius arisanus TaxID=64838 RepID=A0A9R1T3U1_9HYME|nr:PREDICTED: hairy/enhancer-of-split related with YRPW motif protein isoform X2 [Fopius arisanus]